MIIIDTFEGKQIGTNGGGVFLCDPPNSITGHTFWIQRRQMIEDGRIVYVVPLSLTAAQLAASLNSVAKAAR